MCGPEGKGTVGRENAKPGYVESTGLKHRPRIEVRKDAAEEETGSR